MDSQVEIYRCLIYFYHSTLIQGLKEVLTMTMKATPSFKTLGPGCLKAQGHFQEDLYLHLSYVLITKYPYNYGFYSM
jgi:hypothetical protein